MQGFIAWMVAFMVTTAPPGRPQYIPEAQETREEAIARYTSIAQDIQSVVMDQNERVITSGKHARLRMTAILLSIMLHESGFRKDVDYGQGKYARGDGGRFWCMMQLNIGNGQTRAWNRAKQRFERPGDPPDELDTGWYGRELVTDRRNCIRAGLRTVVGTACKRLPPMEWLRAYASGSCGNGSAASRARMGLAVRWFDGHRPDFTDADVFQALNPAPVVPPKPEDPFILRVSRGE